MEQLKYSKKEILDALNWLENQINSDYKNIDDDTKEVVNNYLDNKAGYSKEFDNLMLESKLEEISFELLLKVLSKS